MQGRLLNLTSSALLRRPLSCRALRAWICDWVSAFARLGKDGVGILASRLSCSLAALAFVQPTHFSCLVLTKGTLTS